MDINNNSSKFKDKKTFKKSKSFDISDCIYIGTIENGFKSCDTTIFYEKSKFNFNFEHERKNKIKSGSGHGIWYSVYKRWCIHNESSKNYNNNSTG